MNNSKYSYTISVQTLSVFKKQISKETTSLHLNTSTFVKNRVNENHASGGVAITISDKYDSTEIQLNSNLEAVAISISCPKKIHICNIYIPNSFPLQLQDLEDLIAQLPAPLIVRGL